MANDDARTRILKAAGPIFAEKGYEAATVREICQKAGVNLASVNYYFGGKERLYLEAVERAHPVRIGSGFGPPCPEGIPAETRLKQFIRFLLARLLGVKTSAWQEQLILREVMNPTPACRELLREHFRAGFDHLQGILQEILPPDTPLAKRHQIGFSIIGQCVYHRAARKVIPLIVGQDEFEADYGIDQLADHISQVCLAALGLGPALGLSGKGLFESCESSPNVVEDSAVPAEGSGNGTR